MLADPNEDFEDDGYDGDNPVDPLSDYEEFWEEELEDWDEDPEWEEEDYFHNYEENLP